MANHVGVQVSRLIRERSYAGGEKLKLEDQLAAVAIQIQEAEAAYASLQSAYRVLMARMEYLDEQIKAKIDVRTEDILARQATPKRVRCRHGSMNAELVRFLRDAGRALSTAEIQAHMTTRFGVPTGTAKERESARYWVRDKIKYLVDKDAVAKVHDPAEPGVGLWLWIGI